ncbi:MAG: threonine--tRNA ligase [Actinomycetota bacterium]|nr:threonine--tRNA ligase [Actinomycetota bacterium]
MLVVLPDGSSREIASASTAEEALRELDPAGRLGVVSAAVGGQVQDLSAPVTGREVELIAAASDRGREVLRHSTAHVMAQAVLALWPGAKFAIGPAVADGFYYDFRLPGGERFSEEDLARIETKMREIVASDQPFVREEHSFDEGLDLFADQPYKVEIIQGVRTLGEGEDEHEGVSPAGVSAYRNTEGFVDLCRGPHVPSTGRLGAFKLMRVAGAYWRGDEKRDQLQRVYGTAWESQDALADYLNRLEEAEKRDHRKLGADLDLFHFPPEIGGGLPVFHPKGALVRHVMEDFSMRSHLANGYQLAWTPHIAKSTLYETSGHLGWYKENMYPPMEMEGATYYPKPMNCPMHILIYRSHQRSYRELPMRLFEFGTVYRFERSGVLHGLARVRGLTQDDSHIFVAPSQLPDELARLLGFVIAMLRAFGLSDFEAELATRPEKSVGAEEDWEVATEALEHALKVSGIPYVRAEGEGAFYAPKIDVHLRDAIGRRWQVSTLQVDLQLPQLFDLEFVDADNQRRRPYMVHRALFGSVERFFAILLEHYAGALPTWLSPTQVAIAPVKEASAGYAEQVAKRLRSVGARVLVVPPNEPLGARIRRLKLEKIPYVLVVGDRDMAAGTVGVNARGAERPDTDVALEAFVQRLAGELEPTPLEVADD